MQNRHGNGSGCLKIKGKKALPAEGLFSFSGGQFCCRLFANLACGCLRPHGLYVVPPEASAPCSGSAAREEGARNAPSVRLSAKVRCPVRQGIRTACLPRGNGEPYNGTLSLLAQIKKNPSRLKQRLGHRISYSVVGEPIRRHLYVYAIISAAASRQLFARLRRYPFQIYVF